MYMSDIEANDGVRKTVTLPLGGCVLHVKQDPLSGEHSQVVWDASVCLVKYLERNSTWLSNLISKPGVGSGVVELGAGCSGLCSVAAALLPSLGSAPTSRSVLTFACREDDDDEGEVTNTSTPSVVIATDKACVLPSLRNNITATTGSLKVNASCEIAEIRVRALEWSCDEHVQNVIDELQTACGGIGVVFAADCIFDEDAVDSFVKCTARLCEGGATAIVASERRCERTRTRFERSMRSAGFSFRKVPTNRQHVSFMRPEIEIYIARPSSSSKTKRRHAVGDAAAA